jgi:hypothetical protein
VTELLSSACIPGIRAYKEQAPGYPALYKSSAGPVSGPVRSRRRTGIRPYTEQALGRYPALYGAGAKPVSGPIRNRRRAGIQAYTEQAPGRYSGLY